MNAQFTNKKKKDIDIKSLTHQMCVDMQHNIKHYQFKSLKLLYHNTQLVKSHYY